MNPKVVKFERSAAYVHSRAVKSRSNNRSLDALELLRSAAEKEPDNAEFQLDLAEMYCRMGQYEMSNRVLLEMLDRGNAAAECYYGLALNQLRMGNEDSALRALEIYRTQVDAEVYEAAADDFFSEMDEKDRMLENVPREKMRAIRMASRAVQAMERGEAKTARGLFERSFELGADIPEVSALYSTALALCGEEEAAIDTATRLIGSPDADVHELCIAAHTLWHCGLRDEAKDAILRACDKVLYGAELRMVILELEEFNMHAQAAEKIRLALQETPFDRQLLHMRATALHKSGAPDSECAAVWRRIVRMDPKDDIAAYWLEAAENGRLRETEPEYSGGVPDREYEKRMVRLGLIGLTQGKIEIADDPKIYNDIQWALHGSNALARLAALTCLAAAEDAESVRQLREFMYRSAEPAADKEYVLKLLNASGQDIEKRLPPENLEPRDYLPQLRDVLDEFPSFERQMLRFVDDVLMDEYAISAGAEPAMMWKRYKERDGKNRLACSQEAAGALAWNYLLEKGWRPHVRVLARQFECRTRRMVYYAQHMAAVLEGAENDESH